MSRLSGKVAVVTGATGTPTREFVRGETDRQELQDDGA
jgi:hypothetical protein